MSSRPQTSWLLPRAFSSDDHREITREETGGRRKNGDVHRRLEGVQREILKLVFHVLEGSEYILSIATLDVNLPNYVSIIVTLFVSVVCASQTSIGSLCSSFR